MKSVTLKISTHRHSIVSPMCLKKTQKNNIHSYQVNLKTYHQTTVQNF